MKDLGLEFRVGLFTILGLVATASLVWFIEPSSFEASESSRYYTILKDASGIVIKTQVKTNGVTVGKVSDVTLMGEESRTRIEFEIEKHVRIPKGSVLDIRTVGLLGDKFIEIIRTESAPDGFIPEGGFVPRKTAGLEINELMDIAGEIAKDIKRITGALAETMGDEAGRDKLANILDNLESLSENANSILVDNRSDIRSFVANLKDTSVTLKDVFNRDNRDRINRILASFDESMIEVKGATKNIKLIAERVEQGEGTIGKLVNDDSAITELQGAIKDIRDVLAPATKLVVGVDYHGEARKDDSVQNYFNVKIQTRPDRFYLLGLADADYGYEDEIVETLPVEEEFAEEPATSASSRTKTSRRTRGELRFNLQMAKRWYNSQLRFGLFESEGGVAADYFAFNDRLRLSLEAFEFKTKDNDERRVAHLKAYASVLFFKHIYTMIGVDDITRYQPNTTELLKTPNYFFGAGLQFNDNDLKSVLGVAALAN